MPASFWAWRLAAEASRYAAVSSRQELYPRGMTAVRALRLAQGALVGLATFSADEIRQRVLGRYPEASPIPDRPHLDALLKEADLNVDWDPTARSFVSTAHQKTSLPTSEQISLRADNPVVSELGEISPAEADARQFDDRLRRSLKDGAYLSLLVNPKNYNHVRRELCKRYAVEPFDFEASFLTALREVADRAKVDWTLVEQTDARPNAGDWDKLLLLVGRAMPEVERQLLALRKPTLLIYPGLLARYGQMDLLSRLSQAVGRSNSIPSLWLLLPGDGAAMIDGKPVPLIGPGQRAKVPESWI